MERRRVQLKGLIPNWIEDALDGLGLLLLIAIADLDIVVVKGVTAGQIPRLHHRHCDVVRTQRLFHPHLEIP